MAYTGLDQKKVTGTITTSTSAVAINAEGYNAATFYFSGTYAGVNVTFEQSPDSINGTDGTWFATAAGDISANTVSTTSGVITANSSKGYEISCPNATWVRARATAWTSGTCNVVASVTTSTIEPTPSIGQPTVTIGASAGNVGKAEDATHTSGDVGIPNFGVRYESLTAPTSAANDYGFIQIDSLGKTVVSPYAPAVNCKDANIGAITTTTDTSLFGAIASTRTALTSVTITNNHATVDTLVEIKDNTTVKFRTFAKAGTTNQFVFPTPIFGTANTVMNAACVTTGSSVYVSATAYNAL